MTQDTRQQPQDILPLAMLSHFIVAAYHPDDVVLIAMSHPTNFAVGHRDVVSCSRSHIFSQILYLSIGVDVFFSRQTFKVLGIFNVYSILFLRRN